MTTYWLNVLIDGVKDSDEVDHSIMFKFTDDLDVVCDKLGVDKFTNYLDYTDINYNLNDEFDDESDDVDGGTGYNVADMEWFNINEGLTVFRAIRDSIVFSNDVIDESNHKEQLIEELKSCIVRLEGFDPDSCKFHLSLVM